MTRVIVDGQRPTGVRAPYSYVPRRPGFCGCLFATQATALAAAAILAMSAARRPWVNHAGNVQAPATPPAARWPPGDV